MATAVTAKPATETERSAAAATVKMKRPAIRPPAPASRTGRPGGKAPQIRQQRPRQSVRPRSGMPRPATAAATGAPALPAAVSPEELVRAQGGISAAGLVLLASALVGLAALALGALDLIAGWPFSAVTPLFSAGHVLCGTILLYLSWNAYRDCCK